MAATLHQVHQSGKGLLAHGAVAPPATSAQYISMHLARIRKARGLSQRDLADMIGMDAATVQRAETMHRTAKLATYKRCAEALGVPLEALFCGDGLSAEEELAVQLYRRITPERRTVLVELFRLAETPRPPEA